MKVWLQLVILSLLSGPALATPPYSGTVFVDPDILITDDPSTFQQVSAVTIVMSLCASPPAINFSCR